MPAVQHETYQSSCNALKTQRVEFTQEADGQKVVARVRRERGTGITGALVIDGAPREERRKLDERARKGRWQRGVQQNDSLADGYCPCTATANGGKKGVSSK